MTLANGERSGLEPQRRVVVLGASNVTRGISTIFETARKFWGEPLDFLVAAGHGRSYGHDSSIVIRQLPGITECGLWADLAERPPLPTAALMTDIGNDILLGSDLSIIVRWVNECAARLASCSQRLTITELPVASVETLGPRRFRIMRSLFFPKSRLELPDALALIHELNDAVRDIARCHGAKLVQQRGLWFGFDPIHIRLQHWPAAWREILSTWQDESLVDDWQAVGSWRRWLRLRTLCPHQRVFFGRAQQQSQPAARLRDGSCISLY